MQIFSVSEITYQIKELIEESFPAIWVQGEISNFKPHYSGHFYFTLKDEESQISCVMWKSRTETVDFDFQDGKKVQLLANLRVYVKSGRYQLDVLRVQEAGIGDLQQRFEDLKNKLLREGLFDENRKKKLPEFASKIGVITSPTGAAVKDIISVLKRRNPSVEIILCPVKVQGSGAAREIADAISEMNRFTDVQILIVGRGGGSFEDLWEFNEEVVARAIYNSDIPVISAVGHEVDFTISDFVADARAATPSAAAEIAVPDVFSTKEQLYSHFKIIQKIVLEKISNYRQILFRYKTSYALKRPEDFIAENNQRIDEIITRMRINISNQFKKTHLHLEGIQTRLKDLHPENVLNRGFALVQKNGKITTSVKKIEVGDKLEIRLRDGGLQTLVERKI